MKAKLVTAAKPYRQQLVEGRSRVRLGAMNLSETPQRNPPFMAKRFI